MEQDNAPVGRSWVEMKVSPHEWYSIYLQDGKQYQTRQTFRTYLDRKKAIFAGQRQQAMKLFSNGSVINSTETPDLWLNGFEYHRDADKRTQFEALQSETPPVEVSLNMLAGIMLDRVRAVLDIGNAIYNVRRNMAICPFPGDEIRRP